MLPVQAVDAMEAMQLCHHHEHRSSEKKKKASCVMFDQSFLLVHQESSQCEVVFLQRSF